MTTSRRRVKGLSVVCGEEGVVRELRRDDLRWGRREVLGKPFEALVDPACEDKARSFLAEIRRRGAAFDWELNVPLKRALCSLHFSGARSGDDVLIVAAESRQAMNELWEELDGAGGTSDGVPRASLHRNFDDEMSRLNNELANAHRELAKKNAELEKALEAKGIGDSRFRFLFDLNFIGIVIADPERILEANDAFLATVGYSRADLHTSKLRWRDMTPHEYDQLDENGLRQLFATGKCAPFRKEYIRKDGTRVPILIGAALLQRDPAQWACFVIDVSEHERSEQALRVAEKLSAAARLGASLAHEINNPLAVLTNTMYLLKTQESMIGAAKDLLTNADDALRRIGHITKQLLALHRETAIPSAVRPDAVMDAVVASVESIVADKCAVITRTYQPSTEMIVVESDLLSAFENLVRNASESLPPGGRLNIRITNSRNWHTSASGIRVVVADTGSGIPAEMRRALFEPFVSTKSQGGCGLGLWTVRAIAEKYGGSVRVRSSVIPGRRGTVVSLFFPTPRGTGSQGVVGKETGEQVSVRSKVEKGAA